MMNLVATLILAAGLVDDLRSRKVHNILVGVLFVFALESVITLKGPQGLWLGVLSFAIALILTVPLFALKVLGGGDVKLFAVFALTSTPDAIVWILIYSFAWGALLGLVRSALHGQLLAVVHGAWSLALRKQNPNQMHPMPFTAALLLGWLTHWTLSGGSLW